ncbi:hypothetical protein PTKIN_Ptkin02bG0126900 [Pterospermum kingtungense]
MVSQKYNDVIISRFLFYYQKSKFYTTLSGEKCKVLELVIDMLYTFDPNSIQCKSLFGILRVVLSLNGSKSNIYKLESMIGSHIYQATLDNQLIPSPYGTSSLYDVDLVLRFLKAFLHRGGWQLSQLRMRRDSWDDLYHAIDIYLEVHAGLSEEEKLKIYSAVNYEKLSTEACIHLSQNAKFPSKSAAHALTSQQLKLKNLLQGTNNAKLYIDPPCSFTKTRGKGKKDNGGEQIVIYSRRLDISANNESSEHICKGCNGG